MTNMKVKLRKSDVDLIQHLLFCFSDYDRFERLAEYFKNQYHLVFRGRKYFMTDVYDVWNRFIDFIVLNEGVVEDDQTTS